jgi:TonB family protein
MLHAWLNPQPVVTPPAPESHENFGRAGDEYKLPVAENIPDATTDPSQIHVVPVIDPTAKKPGANGDPAAPDATNTSPTDAAQPTGTQPAGTQAAGAQPVGTQATDPVQGSAAQPNQTAPNQAQPNQAEPNPPQGSQPVQPTPDVAQHVAQPVSAPAAGGTVSSPGATAVAPVEQPHSDLAPVVTPVPVVAQPAAVKNPQPRAASTPANVPSSLKSQMASMTPDASGNKPPEAAMQSIEPVAVTEAAERALLTDQPAIDYPATAKGQQGTVTLQILVGRDGTVQDAKFMQGSLAFARTAIDGVKLWKFKPYSMNGRPVSVQSTMTMSFKPGP